MAITTFSAKPPATATLQEAARPPPSEHEQSRWPSSSGRCDKASVVRGHRIVCCPGHRRSALEVHDPRVPWRRVFVASGRASQVPDWMRIIDHDDLPHMDDLHVDIATLARRLCTRAFAAAPAMRARCTKCWHHALTRMASAASMTLSSACSRLSFRATIRHTAVGANRS